METTVRVETELELVGICRALGVANVRGMSAREGGLLDRAVVPSRQVVREVEDLIAAGEDPLGEAFCRLRSPVQRRPAGATYTPGPIVRSMTAWAAAQREPRRVIDPGVGSGRFLAAAAKMWPRADLVGVEVNPVAALMARATLAARGAGARATILLADYRSVSLGRGGAGGPTMFLGNPPYVRHHLLGDAWKAWLTATAERRGYAASQLAGLHVHFFLATLEHAVPGDIGAFVTASEWLDVNYGALVRSLFLGELGGTAIHVIEPKAIAFSDAQTTAAITCFQIGTRPRSIRLRRVESLEELHDLAGGHRVRRERLAAASRWSPITHSVRRAPEGYVELGELCRVRRGQVTGANDFWIAADHARDLPDRVLYPTVTRARELYSAGRALVDTTGLRRVIDLPHDLDVFTPDEKRVIEALLRRARRAGVDRGYIARQRRAWWRVGLHEPAPILATYMARRAPGFVRNLGGARHINIAHGLYPRETMSDAVMDRLTAYLSTRVSLRDGRTYAGGLVKFEPREMERLLVPAPGM